METFVFPSLLMDNELMSNIRSNLLISPMNHSGFGLFLCLIGWWLVGWLFKDKIKLTFYDELDLISNLIENFLSV